MLDWQLVLLLAAAGVLAGVIGTAGGTTSLISYPALLLAGLSASDANVVNLVAAVACWPAAAAASRKELTEVTRWLPVGAVAAAVGAGAGTALFILTSARTFDLLIPLLVALGSAALLLQPRITARRSCHHDDRRTGAVLTVGGISVYSGYFGAGSGVMLLAACLILLDPRLPEANALKNTLLGASTLASAAILITIWPVRWEAAIPLAAGLFLGSLVGPVVARRLPATVIRWAAALLGFALAIGLALNVLFDVA